MATTPMNRVIQHLLATCGREGMTDGELLSRFLGGRDAAALAALVGRHGPMVWGVCCRLLRSHQDAEDAFQATFLVLVQKAGTLPEKEMVGNWLFGVARQTAVRMRAIAAKRGVRERQVPVMPEPTTNDQHLTDLKPFLDEELSHLPAKYRALIVLCDMEGKTRKEVARQLDVPEGTVASRLATARVMLAKRLTKRGTILSGGLIGTVLSQQALSAAVPAVVLSSTIKAVTLVAAGQAAGVGLISTQVAALTKGVVKTMLMIKLKTAGAVLLVCIGGGVAVTPMVMGTQPNNAQLQKATETHNAQLREMTEAHNPQLSKMTALHNQQIMAMAEGKQQPLTSKDLVGTWSGERDGVKIKVVFSGAEDVTGMVEETGKGGCTVDLKRVDKKPGLVQLRFDTQANPKGTIVGHLERGDDGTLKITILPIAATKFSPLSKPVEGFPLNEVKSDKK